MFRRQSQKNEQSIAARQSLRAAERKAVKAIAAAARSKPADVVRLVNDAYDHKLIPHSRNISRWIRRAFPSQWKSVLGAFADQRCHGCKRGLEICGTCRGDGTVTGGVCQTCDGFGAVVCSFCNGSGLANYDFVPPMLRPEIVKLRLDAAAGLIRDRGASTTHKELAQRILELNRARSIVDNVIAFSRASRPAEPFEPNYLPGLNMEKLSSVIGKIARTAEVELKRLLKQFGELVLSRSTDDESKEAVLGRHLLRLAAGNHYSGGLLNRKHLTTMTRRAAAPAGK